MNDNATCCTHTRVEHKIKNHPEGTCSEYWQCVDCLRRFEPIVIEQPISEYQANQYFRDNKWSVRIIRRGADYDTAEVVKCLGFSEEVILGRGLWPDHANTICNEHNDSLAKALFQQKMNQGKETK